MLDASSGAAIGGWVGSAVAMPKTVLSLTGLFLSCDWYKDSKRTCWIEVGPGRQERNKLFGGFERDETCCTKFQT